MTESKTIIPEAGEDRLVDMMLFDTFVTALEGGINYWAVVSQYHQEGSHMMSDGDLAGFFAVIHNIEPDDTFTTARVDRSTIADGFARLTEGPVKYMGEGQRHMFLAMLHARLAGLDDNTVDIDYDAGDADNLLQVGLFGEVIFG